MTDAYLSLAPGAEVTIDGVTWVVGVRLSLERVTMRRRDDGTTKVMDVDAIAEGVRRSRNLQAVQPTAIDPTEGSDEDWAIAQRRLTFIEGLLGNENRKRSHVVKVAEVAGVDTSTVYEWIKRYRDGGLAGLLPMSRGPKRGSHRLDPDVEAVITKAIEELYLTKERPSVQQVVERVKANCAAAGLKAPNVGTVKSRISAIDPRIALTRRSQREKARDELAPIRGSFPDRGTPLSVVQIDHTQANVEVVDDKTREPCGKPWMTLSICVSTRMVTSFYATMEHPSASSVGMCVSRAILPKRAYLASLDVTGEWPVWGKPAVLHADNAKEFRGKMLARACLLHDIEPKFRPGRTPHYGGHIERLIGTALREVEKLPGTTFANPQARKGYDSERMATMTLQEFEAYMVDWIVNSYHKRYHSALKMSPLRKWQLGIEGDGSHPGIGLPPLPADEETLRRDFMAFEERTIQPYGVLIEGIHYWDEVLKSFLRTADDKRKAQTKYVFRFDPEIMNVIYFWDPDTRTYYDIPYRDTSRPAVSRFEIREARRELRQQGVETIDEQAIFDTVERLRQRVEQSKERTKDARRKAQRQRQTEARERDQKATRKRGKGGGTVSEPGATQDPKAPRPRTFVSDDIFAQEVTPYERRVSSPGTREEP